jgi:hypothetical protein
MIKAPIVPNWYESHLEMAYLNEGFGGIASVPAKANKKAPPFGRALFIIL